MNTACLRRLIGCALTTTALWSAPSAHALGHLADIQVLDRDSGETLPVFRHRGEHWVAGRPGARYAVSVRNTMGARVLGVVSVDGVNVVSGETAAWGQTGYVLGPWQQYSITGWRKSDSEVAAFHFTASPASYAARTGRPDHVGVIGVAVFREKEAAAPPPALPVPQHGQPYKEHSSEAQPSLKGNAQRTAPFNTLPRLGTGHGERETAWVGQTLFERRSHRPDELIRIRYDSRENLLAMGVIPVGPVPPHPHPFPETPHPRYVPDPN